MKPGLWERRAKCDMAVGPHGYWYYSKLEDGEHVGMCLEFPSLSWVAPTPEAAVDGVVELVSGVLRDMRERGELPPAKASSDLLTYSVACGCGATAAGLTFDQAVAWTNGPAHVCPAQCCVCGSPNGKGERELRPYGPDFAPICWGCASKPEHEPSARAMYAASLAAALDADSHGMAALTSEGPVPLDTTDAASGEAVQEVLRQVDELLDSDPAGDVRVVLVRDDYDPEDGQ